MIWCSHVGRAESQRLARDFEDLRNSLAHAQDIVTHDGRKSRASQSGSTSWRTHRPLDVRQWRKGALRLE
jgi:hypothetical protein